jgi:FtsH-binding integral membrane protein
MNIPRILEVSWLITSIVALGLFVYHFFSDGLSAAFFPLIFAFITFCMYLVRRKQRISYEKKPPVTPPADVE